MTKRTLCLLFVLALIAQIAAFPADKAEAEAKADADKAVAEGKKKAGDATAEAESIADAAKAAGKRRANDAAEEADAAAKPKKNEHAHPNGHPHTPTHGKDCHKPGSQLTKAVDTANKWENKFADLGAKAAKDVLRIFGL